MPRRLRSNTLVSKLILTLVPALVLLLAVTGYLTYRISAEFIAIALHRNAKVQNLGQLNAIETYLESCKNELLYLARQHADTAKMRNFLERQAVVTQRQLPFLAFISLTDDRHMLLVQNGEKFLELDSCQLDDCAPDLLPLYDHVRELAKDTTWLSGVVKASYPFPTAKNTNNRLSLHVLQLVAPVYDGEQMRGFYVLALPVKDLRNILSRYNSSLSPLWAYARSPEVRFSFFFNLDGWVLFQSESPEHPNATLSTYLMRSECEGTMGLPSLETAFRPGSSCKQFWKIVAEVREGSQGLVSVSSRSADDCVTKGHSMAYAPVRFRPGLQGEQIIYAGVAFEDRSRLTLMAGYKHVDIMFLITLAAGILATLLIYLLSCFVTRPLLRLTKAVQEIRASGKLDPVNAKNASYETALLQEAINNMLQTMRQQIEEIHIRDLRIKSDNMREPVEFEQSYMQLAGSLGPVPIPEIVGFGSRMDTLREEILKAAKVDVDVLIVGETGTGKQLTAEAIHKYSPRKELPFISINCGELDENLLMDTLFGHVKGAFTEARGDRKGAFLEADGGTLFLDEIQVASPRVQQSLLRAIALRKIKPLGSDKDTDVDVRVIAATNIDLRHLIQAKIFREDLYFRLKVITIHTPPLREHKENILLLAMHYLREAERLTGKQGLILSKGALERMKLYSWPGNVRELRNCVTRAAVMSEAEIILAEELLLDNDAMAENQTADVLDVQQPGEQFNDNESGPDTARKTAPPPPEDTRQSREMFFPGEVRERETPPKEHQDGTGAHAPAEDLATPAQSPPAAGEAPKDSPPDLHPRQQRAWELILDQGGISRSEYEALFGGEISSRTAVYDLQDMVAKGLLRKKGHGPATRYVLPHKS